MSELSEHILESYFRAHKELVDAEDLDNNTVAVSFPVYFSSNHRVELAVQHLSSGMFLISDKAEILSELRLAGLQITGKMRERILNVATNSQLRFVGNSLVRECSSDQLGDVLHLFADSCKTIGDAYLVHRTHLDTEDELRAKVKHVLLERKYVFKEHEPIKGEIETHDIDFYLPPNGIPGLALSVLPKPTRLTAEAWAFKASDIKKEHEKLKVGLVYGDAKETPRDIITRKIDLAIPASDLDAIANGIVPLWAKKSG